MPAINFIMSEVFKQAGLLDFFAFPFSSKENRFDFDLSLGLSLGFRESSEFEPSPSQLFRIFSTRVSTLGSPSLLEELVGGDLEPFRLGFGFPRPMPGGSEAVA